MAVLNLEITDVGEDEISVRLLADAQPPHDPAQRTPAQRLAMHIREVIVEAVTKGEALSGEEQRRH